MTRMARRLETVDRTELELPARIGLTRGLSEIDVADDADVAVRGVVLVVEHVEHVGPELDAVAVRQRKRARHGEVREPDWGAARRVPPFWRRHVAGPLSRAEDLRRAGQILRVADAIRIA